MEKKEHCGMGLFGGSFNPVHIGHLSIVQQVRNELHLDKVRLVPAAVNPFKLDDPEMAPAEDRLEMCRLAVKNLAGLEVCDIEIKLGGVSYTADTLRLLWKENSWRTPPVLITGSDAAAGLVGWKDAKRIIDELAYVVIVERRGTPLREEFWSVIEAKLGEARADKLRRQVVAIEKVDVSSTLIRNCIRLNRPLRGMLRHSVEVFIRAKGLYRKNL